MAFTRRFLALRRSLQNVNNFPEGLEFRSEDLVEMGASVGFSKAGRVSSRQYVKSPVDHSHLIVKGMATNKKRITANENELFRFYSLLVRPLHCCTGQFLNP